MEVKFEVGVLGDGMNRCVERAFSTLMYALGTLRAGLYGQR